MCVAVASRVVDLSPPLRFVCACAATESHAITQILLDQGTLKDIRFSVSKLFWVELPFYSTLEDRVLGTFKQWTRKADFKVSIR